MSEKTKKLAILFTSALTLSAFTFGGGYVIVPLMQRRFTESLGWLEDEEMRELVSIAQSSPGTLAINCAVLVGYRVAGFPGALLGLVGTILPPLVILSVVCVFYERIRNLAYVGAIMRGLLSGVAAVIAHTIYKMARGFFNKKNAAWLLVMLPAFAAVYFFKINVVIIIILSGAIGALSSAVAARRNARKESL